MPINNMTDIVDIKSQRLSTLLSDFSICKSCQIVDRIHNGTPCPACNIQSAVGRSYFRMSVHQMIDLMQEYYHTESPQLFKKSDSHKVAIVIFFCTLAEILMEWFLINLMNAKELSVEIQDRMLEDNKYLEQRTNKLFPSLTGDKWKDVVNKLSDEVELDYNATSEFYKVVNKARNVFVHRGSIYSIKSEMPQECIENIWPLINLFVSLHNHYVHPIFFDGKLVHKNSLVL